MFGYVMADQSQLSDGEKARYSGCYCGLCRRLGTNYGQLSRMTLTYDLTFLILVLNSLYGGKESLQCGRCAAHPGKRHESWYSAFTDYGAAMNVALSYYKCLDDWQDDRKLPARLMASALHKRVRKIEQTYPRQCAAMVRELAVLGDLERRGINDPDAASASFGRLMAELFVWQEDGFAPALRAVGFGLGEYIYLLDAWLDLREDLKRERYNPLTALPGQDIQPVLTMLLAQGAQALETLPLKWDQQLIYNIYYSGVWMKYHSRVQKREEEHG